MKEILLNVEGIACGGCENRIQNAVSTIKGVKKVIASHIDGTVKVEANVEIDENIIKERINDLGFTVKE